MINKKYVALFVFIFVYLAGIAGYSFYSYNSYKDQYIHEIDAKLKSVVAMSSEIVGAKYHENLKNIDEKEYLALCTKLSDIADNFEIKYIYTLIEKDGKIYFTSSSYTKQELAEKSYTQFMDNYKEASPSIHDTFKAGSINFDESTDRWGTFRSIYLPMSTSTGEKFIIGADVELGVIESKKAEILKWTILTALFFLALILPSLIIYIFAIKKEKAELENIINEKTAELREFNKDLKELAMQLSKYLSPQIYNKLFQKQSQAKIGTKRKRLTVFFSDIKGFTTITEALEPEDLTFLLNSYLNEMSTVALEYGATIDKFIGDAILIFFGDPDSRGEQGDAILCVQMAAKMHEKLENLQKLWRERGITQSFEVRMGIASGYCTVGNFGSESRMDYTIIGNTVNLASRLESNAPAGGILISQETYLLIKDMYQCEEKGKIEVKGFKEPVETYLVSHKSEKNILKEEGEGFSFHIDIDAMTPEGVKNLLNHISEAIEKKNT